MKIRKAVDNMDEERTIIETKGGINYYNDGSWEAVDGSVCCDEFGNVCESLTDADCDKYAVQVMNEEGYYNDEGRFQWYSHSRE